MFKLFMFFSGITMFLVRSEILPEKDFDFNSSDNIRETILLDELDYDSQAFRYLLESSYSGYEDAIERGLDLEKMTISVRKKFEKEMFVSTEKLAQELISAINPYVNDVHFCICTNENLYKSFTSEKVYFSEIFLKKKGNDFVVSEIFDKNMSENIQVGTQFTDSGDLLFQYPSKGKDIYRLGIKTTEENESFSKDVMFGDKKYKINFKETKRNDYYENTVFKEFETKDSAYIKITDFMEVLPQNDDYKSKQEILRQYVNCAKKYINKKNIILDLRENSGGNDEYSFNFFKNLYGHNVNIVSNLDSSCSSNLEYLVSKPIKEFVESDYVWKRNAPYYLTNYEQGKKNWFSMKSRYSYKLKSPKFKGTIFIISDKKTASSGEATIFFAKKLFSKTNQVKVVGENSAGCITYGNVLNYKLPNSGLIINIPSSKYVCCINGNEVNIEGKGFYPDYWSSDEDIKQTLVNLTGDGKLENCFE